MIKITNTGKKRKKDKVQSNRRKEKQTKIKNKQNNLKNNLISK